MRELLGNFCASACTILKNERSFWPRNVLTELLEIEGTFRRVEAARVLYPNPDRPQPQSNQFTLVHVLANQAYSGRQPRESFLRPRVYLPLKEIPLNLLVRDGQCHVSCLYILPLRRVSALGSGTELARGA